MSARTATLAFAGDAPSAVRTTALAYAATGAPVLGVALPAQWTPGVGGTFAWSFEGDAGVRYQYVAIATVGGVDAAPVMGFVEIGTTVGVTPTAAEMVAIIRAALAVTPVGVVTVTIDGQVTTWDREKAMDELERWERRAAAESGRRPRIVGIDLSGY